MRPFESRQFRLARRNLALAAVATLMICLGLIGIYLNVAAPSEPNAPLSTLFPLVFALVLGPMGLILLRYWWLRNPRPRLRPAHVQVEGDELRIEGLRRRITRPRMREGLLLRRDDGSYAVRLERAWPRPPIELVADHQAVGEALLAALALDVTQNRARFSLAPLPGLGILQSIGCLALVAGGLQIYFGDAAIGAALSAIFLALTFVARWPAHVDVGSDGLTLRTLGERRRFIAHEHIDFVYRFGLPHETTQGVELLMRDGSKVQLQTRSGFTSEITADRTARFFQRVMDSRARWRGAVRHLTALLDGADREPRAWVHALRESARGGHPHRTVRIDPDELWAVLEDPAAAPATRSGAAIALGARSDHASRERIRVAARATAADDVRQALELAAEEDVQDEALAEALVPLLRAAQRMP